MWNRTKLKKYLIFCAKNVEIDENFMVEVGGFNCYNSIVIELPNKIHESCFGIKKI